MRFARLRQKSTCCDRVHGSGMFTSGQTQVLTVATLGPVSDAQILDGIDERRHQALYAPVQFPVVLGRRDQDPREAPDAARLVTVRLQSVLLLPVIPRVEEFPYCHAASSPRCLSSNGSTSQASICGSTLALMAAGVPIKAPVAGISCGLITEGDRWMTMVDIQGLEDFFGDMDFKVGGTKKGITAIQMDLKIHGLTPADHPARLLDKTYKARCYILDEVMLPVHLRAAARSSPSMLPRCSPPRLTAEKIARVSSAQQGKVIQKICAECNCQGRR